MHIPLSQPDITELEIAYVNQVLRTTQLSMGPMIERFEADFANYIGTNYAVGVCNGTAGLHTSILASGVKNDDLVLTTPFSFIASANCILYQGATPIFVDIDPDTLNIDSQKLEIKLKELYASGRDVKAVLPVHVFGQPCDMNPIMYLAEQWNIDVIEDACEAVGAEYINRKVGTFGLAAVFSFYPNKQMTLGEGGVIVTDDEEFADLCRSIRNQGRNKDKSWLDHIRLGYNYRLNELSAALGVGQLERIEELLEKRRVVASLYNERLSGIEGVRIPYTDHKTNKMSWFVYVIRLDSNLDRNNIMASLESSGIPTRPYFAPIHLQHFYRTSMGYREGDFPITESIASSTLALPFYGDMTEAQVDYVCEKLRHLIH